MQCGMDVGSFMSLDRYIPMFQRASKQRMSPPKGEKRNHPPTLSPGSTRIHCEEGKKKCQMERPFGAEIGLQPSAIGLESSLHCAAYIYTPYLGFLTAAHHRIAR